LDELKSTYAGKLDVVFIDVWENPDAAKPYGIESIPTQIFFNETGKELYRHVGFMAKEDILAKWKELGVNLSGPAESNLSTFERLVPAQEDQRPKDAICYMCDGNIDSKTLVTVKTEHGDVRLCNPHCYFIMYSCLTEDKTNFENKVTIADFESGSPVPLQEAVFLVGTEESGRPTIRSFASSDSAKRLQQTIGGNIVSFLAFKDNELSHRCGFCDRACYPQDSAKVLVSSIQTLGCCSHCAIGVAARTGQDIEVHEKDRLTGEPIVVKTLNGSIASIEPATAVAWFGQRQKADGTWSSAGCFHQGFFVNADNLKKWVQQNPYETGKLISIHQALADKMKLTEAQIKGACKIGQCSPK
jgi:thiol-disulfide isomerase/thioredoxin